MSLLTLVVFSTLIYEANQDVDELKQRPEELEIAWVHPGHASVSPFVSRLAMSPDGIHLASTTGAELSVKIWNVRNKKYERSLCAYPYLPVTSIDYSSDGKKLLVTFTNESVVYDTAIWNELARYEHTESSDVIFAGSSIFLADRCQAFDQENRQASWTLPKPYENLDSGHFKSMITSWAARTYISPDHSRFLIPGGFDHTPKNDDDRSCHTVVTYINSSNLQLAKEALYSEEQNALDPSKARQIIGWSSPSSLVCLIGNELVTTNLDLENVKPFDRLPVNSASTQSVTCLHSIGGNYLGISYPDPNRPKQERFQLYDKSNMQKLGNPIPLRFGQGSGIALYNDRPFVFGNILSEIDFSGRSIWDLTKFSGSFTSLFADKGSQYAAIALLNHIQIWNPAKPDDSWMISIPDPIKASGINTNRPPTDTVATDIFLWDGKVIGATVGPFVFIADASTGKNIAWHAIGVQKDLRDRPIVRYVMGGEQFIAGLQLGSGGLKRYDTMTGKVLAKYAPSSQVSILAATDQYVAAVTDSKLRVWEVESAKLVFESTLPMSGITRIALEQSRKLLVTGNREGTVKVIDLVSGKVKHQLQCDKRAVVNLLATPDGRLVTRTESSFGVHPVRIWDIATGEELGHYAGEVGPCDIPESMSTDMVFNAKTNELVMGRNDCTVIAFKMPKKTEN